MLILRNHPRIKKSQKSPYLKLKLGTFILLSELTVFVSVKKARKVKLWVNCTMKKSITSLKSTHLDDCNVLPFSYHLIVASGSAVTAQSIVLFLPMITSLFLGGMPSVHLGGTKEKHITVRGGSNF